MDDMFSKDEVEDILSSLLGAVTSNARRDLERSAQMGALVVEQLIAQAKKSGCEVVVEMSKAEDEGLLADVGKVKVSDEVSKEDDLARRPTVKLESMGTEHARLSADAEKLAEQIKTLTDRNKQMMAQLTTAMKEKAAVAAELADAKDELGRVKSASEGKAAEAASSAAGASGAVVSALKGQVAALQAELADTKALLGQAQEETSKVEDEAGKKVTQTKQFQQLKTMLAKKNEQLLTLRKRLEKYEPDDTELADDDGPSHK